MHQIHWLVPTKVLYIELSDIITDEEIAEINLLLVEDYLNKSRDEIQIVVSGEKVKKLSVQIGESIAVTRKIANHPKLGHSIYVSMGHPLKAFIVNSIAVALGYRYSLVNTLPDVYKILENLGEI